MNVQLQELWQAIIAAELERWAAAAQQQLLTEERAYAELLQQHLRRRLPLARPFTPQSLRPGDWAEAETYNYNLQAADRTLAFLVQLCRFLGDRELQYHNTLLGYYLRLREDLQALHHRATDLSLFQRDLAGGVLLVSDHFTSAARIDTVKPRDYDAAYLDTYLGGVTLVPVRVTSPGIRDLILNPDSNGVPGNNNELWVAIRRDDPQTLVDGRLDTWFEYERVSPEPGDVPLVLDLTLSFHHLSAINRLRLYFNNLGHLGWPKLVDLQVSADGQSFTSLLPELQWQRHYGQQVLDLEPQASTTGGLLHLAFQPRYVRHLRLILSQSTHYFIQTPAGQMCRYAIALREVMPLGVIYGDKAELLSTAIALPQGITKVALATAEVLSPSPEVCRIQHYLSHDGTSWQEIQPVQGLQASPDKILSFAVPPQTLYYRAVLERLPMEQARASARQLVEQVDLLQFPALPPHTLSLTQVPEASSLMVYLPMAGSYGRDTRWPLGQSDGTPHQTFTVSFPLPPDSRVWVNRTWWRTVTSLAAAGNEEVCLINHQSNRIQFGDGTHGAIPPGGARITLELPPARLLFVAAGDFVAALPHPCVPQAGQLRLYRLEPPVTAEQVILPKGSRILRLPHQRLVPHSLTVHENAQEILKRLQAFRDGQQELTQAGDYSVDWQQGIIYTYSLTPVDQTLSVAYDYVPRHEVPYGQWSFRDWQYLVVPAQYFTTMAVNRENLHSQAGAYVVQLRHSHLINQRLSFNADSGLTMEVPFIDGHTEFRGVILKHEWRLPVGGRQFTLPYAPLKDYPVVFSDRTVFRHRVQTAEEIAASGDYHLNFDTGVVQTADEVQGGQVTFYRLQNLQDLQSVYSVDYRQGRVHLPRPLPPHITVSYEYCHYEAEYYLTEILPPTTYTVYPEQQILQITDLPYLQQLQQRYTTEDAIAVRYQYYQTEPLAADTFQMITPILQSYQLRLLPKAQ